MKYSNRAGVYLALGLPLAHTLLFRFADSLTAVVLPALCACIYTVLATRRSEQQLRIMQQSLTRPVRGLAVFTLLTAAAFYFGGDELSLKLQIARALLADLTAAILGGIIALRLHRRSELLAAD